MITESSTDEIKSDISSATLSANDSFASCGNTAVSITKDTASGIKHTVNSCNLKQSGVNIMSGLKATPHN